MLVPPILLRVLASKPKKTYDDFDSAIADTDTYEDPDIIKVVSVKTQLLTEALQNNAPRTITNRSTLQASLAIMHGWSGRPLEILEIGGACGANYFELNGLLPHAIRRWVIVETAEMANAGRELFQTDALIFVDNVQDALKYLQFPSILVAQGVLQYLREPLNGFGTWLELGFPFIYLGRTLVGDQGEEPIVSRQVSKLSEHGPGPLPEGFTDRRVSYPMTLIPHKRLLSAITKNYGILVAFEEGRHRTFRIGLGSVRVKMIGYLLRRGAEGGV